MAFISNGTTILDNGAFDVSLGNLVLLSEQTASSSASIEFTTGIDSTYPIYKFEFINMHPSNDGTSFQYQASTNGGSSYGVNKVSTFFEATHSEGDSSTGVSYNTTFDRGANATDFITLSSDIGNDTDQSISGELFLFNPSSTTFVKHYLSKTQASSLSNISHNDFVGGYFNTTSAIDALIFEMRVGNTDSGTIKLYGIKDS